MDCKQIAEKLFVKKANLSEQDLIKYVMLEFTPEKIELLRKAGQSEDDIKSAIENTINVVLRNRRKLFGDTLQYDLPTVNNTTSSLLGMIFNNYQVKEIGATEYELRNVLRQTSQKVELLSKQVKNKFLQVFNDLIDDEGNVINPATFYNDPKRKTNLIHFFRTGEAVGDSMEMQIQHKLDTVIEDISKDLKINKQSIYDRALINKADLILRFKREKGTLPKIRSFILGDRRYAFLSQKESFEFRDWFKSHFKDVVPDEKELDILYDEMFKYSKNLMSDFDERDTTTLGGFTKFENLRRREILNDDIVNRWLEIADIDGEGALESIFQSTSTTYGILNSFGSKPLKNAELSKNIVLNSISATGDIVTQKNLEKAFKEYQGMIKYILGDRSYIEPNILLDSTEILTGVFRATKAPLMALRQLDDFAVRNFFNKKFSDKNFIDSLGDNLKFTARAMFSDDFKNLSLKDKEVVLDTFNSLAADIFMQSNELTRHHSKTGGILTNLGDKSYRYLSGMGYHERMFERSGLLYTSNIIKDLQNRNFKDIMKVDDKGIATNSILRRSIQEAGITEREFELFKKVAFSTEYFSSEELNKFLRDNKDEVKKLLYLGNDNMDFSLVAKSIENKTKSMLPYQYDAETGYLSPKSMEKLANDVKKYLQNRAGVDDVSHVDWGYKNLENIQYINKEIIFHWKPELQGLTTLKDAVERDFRMRFLQETEEVSRRFSTAEYKKILKDDKARAKFIEDYNKYVDKIDETKLKRMALNKIEEVTNKFQDLRNNMFYESSILRYDYLDRSIMDKAMGDTKSACINKMFSFYKAALWKNTERFSNYFRDYDLNGEISTKNFFNRYAMADSAHYLAMAGLYGSMGMVLTGEILKEDDTNVLAKATQNSIFIGTGLYTTMPIRFLDDLVDVNKSLLVERDGRKAVQRIKRMGRNLFPSTILNYKEALQENY